ncbi:MAG: formyl transferase [Halieaceae bacterium]|jgi:methionyl-tRNA formyltransferase|nr:formyl transferase [Halieaceae bacterium]
MYQGKRQLHGDANFMKILLLANSDLASNYALNLLLPRLQGHELKLLLSSSVGSSSQHGPELQALKFFEQQLFSELVFPLLCETSAPGMTGFDGFSRLLSEPVSIENNINSTASLARVTSFSPELIVSIRYGGILKDPLIAMPKMGVINLHSGRLPQYRGVMASFWAMLSGDEALGTTLHTIDDGSIDTGRVIASTSAVLDREKSYLGNVLDLYESGVEILVQAIAALASGETLSCIEQQQGGSYYSFPSAQDLERFTAMGYVLYSPQEVLAFAREHYLGGQQAAVLQ